MWTAADKQGVFGALIKMLLLTGQRREKVATMRWQDVSVDGVWTIPAEAREKGNARELVLPEAALQVIRSRPRLETNPYIFAGRTTTGETDATGWSRATEATANRMLELAREESGDEAFDIEHWTLHDLRRTAKSLMARAGVRPDISERVLGHAIQGVEGTYDRHRYVTEKAHALKALAGMIGSIINPPAGNVVALTA